MLYVKLATALYARTHDMAVSVIAKRALEKGTSASDGELWLRGLFVVDFVIFLPVLLYLSYTLGNVFPILAMVEGRSNYEQIRPEEDKESKVDAKVPQSPIEESNISQSRPVASSIRAMHRLLYSIGGLTSVFRGYGAFVIYHLSEGIASYLLSFVPIVPSVFLDITAALIVVQLHTAWVHIVIKDPSRKSFIHHIPSFKTTLCATAIPTVIVRIAEKILIAVPVFLSLILMGSTGKALGIFTEIPRISENKQHSWALAAYLGVYLAVLVLSVPASVVLTRIQASLLPADERTIVSFDKSFGIEGSGHKSYLSIVEAFKSFRGSWCRLYKLHVKIVLINIAVQIFIVAVMITEFLILAKIFKS